MSMIYRKQICPELVLEAKRIDQAIGYQVPGAAKC